MCDCAWSIDSSSRLLNLMQVENIHIQTGSSTAIFVVRAVRLASRAG